MHLKHCLLPAAAVVVVFEEVMLTSLPGQLCCGDAVVQKIGLHALQRVLGWRPVFGEALVGALKERHVLAALVQLLQPGTDAGGWASAAVVDA